MEEKSAREETAIVLDFLPNGYPNDPTPSHRKQAIIQAIGKKHFTLLELTAKKDAFLQPLEEIYLGEGKRDKVQHIVGKLDSEKLTAGGRKEVEFVVQDMVSKGQERFVSFFNTAQPLTTRMHQLELLPGLGKKHMWAIIQERDEKEFANFADLRSRVHLMPDPQKIVVKRVLSELWGEEKHNVFVNSPE
jgi:putative nucleotide binding protein